MPGSFRFLLSVKLNLRSREVASSKPGTSFVYVMSQLHTKLVVVHTTGRTVSLTLATPAPVASGTPACVFRAHIYIGAHI